MVRSSDPEIVRLRDRDPIRVMIHDTLDGQIHHMEGVKLPSICICPRANEWVQQPGHKGKGPYSCCLGVVLLLGLKPRASHDPNGVRMLTPYVIIDTSCHDVDMLKVRQDRSTVLRMLPSCYAVHAAVA